VKEGTAASILAAARELLDREGSAAVAMRPVAERVGITPMAIYRHYADRASLLNAIADEGFRELAARVQQLRLKGSVEQRLKQVANVFLDAALKHPNLYELMFLVRREGARVYPEDFKAGRSPTFNPTVAILEEAMLAGELRPDIR
jgi:AcrR family transcriptional regulator